MSDTVMNAFLRPHRRAPRDEGRIALLVIVLTVAVLAMIGLSVDGGGKIRALQRADNLASEAARTSHRRPGSHPGRRQGRRPGRRGRRRAELPGRCRVTGTVSVSPDRRRITVTVTIVYTTVFLDLVGIDTLTATRQATAVVVAT